MDSIKFEDMQGDNVNIADQLELNQDEQIQIKGDELDYQIQAVKLNKIDEESVEHTSESNSN